MWLWVYCGFCLFTWGLDCFAGDFWFVGFDQLLVCWKLPYWCFECTFLLLVSMFVLTGLVGCWDRSGLFCRFRCLLFVCLFVVCSYRCCVGVCFAYWRAVA